MTIRLPMMYAVSNAAQHSDRPYATMMTIPGLKIVVASNALDQYGLLKSAIREDDPVLVFEDITCYGVKNDVPDEDEDFTVPLGTARVARGCSWHEPPEICRSATRLKASPAYGDDLIGFRVAL